jgi:hypothetical protein
MMGLGSIQDRSLEEARAERDRLRKILKLEKQNPLLLRREAEQSRRAKADKALSFREVAERFFQENRQSWRSARHARSSPTRCGILCCRA